MATQSGSSATSQFATDLEIYEAIQSLSKAEKNRLLKAAVSLFARMDNKQFGLGPLDLLQEATSRTASGVRHWNKRMSFERHLTQTMRSIASAGKKKKKEPKIALDRGFNPETEDSFGEQEWEPFVETVASPAVDLERRLEIQQTLKRLKVHLADVPDAWKVCTLVMEGWTASEMEKELGIPVPQIETLLKRIRDRARKLLKRGEL